MGFFDAIHAAFHQRRTRAYQVVSAAVWTLIVVSVVLLAVEALAAEAFVEEDSRFFRVLRQIDDLILAAFGVELVLRVLSYRPPDLDVFRRPPLGALRTHIQRRLTYCLSPLVLVDIITVLAVVPALRGLRALRLLRLLRSRKLFRYANPFAGLMHAFEHDRLLFIFAFGFLGAETLLGGVSIFLVERADNASINSLGDGLWWAIVTITTVGFGDISAVTTLGRIVAGILMVGGMFTLAIFAGIVTHSILHTVLSIREEQFRMAGYVNHIVICGYDEGTRMLLDTLLKEVDPDQQKVVIFADSPRVIGVPPEFMWVTGDPTKESELDKVRLSHASAIIIAGERTIPPQHADAKTILTAFTIRSHLAGHESARDRRRPLHILAEILESENVDHARAAGADEVIETRKVGFSLLAHAITNPGTADVMSRVVLSGDSNVYVGKVPPGVQTPSPFGEVARSVRAEKGVLVVGLRDPETGHDQLNPSDATLVERGAGLIYLSEKPALEAP